MDSDDDMDMRLAAEVAQAAHRIGSEGTEQRAAVHRFIRGENITWGPTHEDCAQEFIAGYEAALTWLRTNPPRAEVEEIDRLYIETRPGGPADDATIYADADQLPHFLAHVPTLGLHADHFEVEDGAKLKAQMVRDYGAHLQDTFTPPARTFVWASLHRLYEGLGLACHHEVQD